MKLRSHLCLTTCLAGLAASARAETVVNVAFTPNGGFLLRGPRPDATKTDWWNGDGLDAGSTPPTAVTGLIDSTGFVPTSIGYTETTAGTGEFTFGAARDGESAELFFTYADRGSGGDMAFTISGLVANTSYQLYVYAGRNTDLLAASTGETATVTTLSMSYAGPQTDFIEGTNYVRFSGLVDASGNVSFTSLTGILNGFTIVGTAVPEPSTYAAIAGAAMLGLAVWRRRSRTGA